MALLAEQKKKSKFGLDPRNTGWSNDSSKFGQRLMEKMGWEKGKGLGAHEDGITEHIKASYKSDSRGLGCTHQDADAWIAHQDDFNDLLKALNSKSEADSQEEKAEQTKHVDGHRRYYGRFSRGQVQTLRSTDDLDCIFGKRKRKSKTEPDEQPDTKLDCSDDTEEKRHGLTTVTSTSSVQEYFAKKMAEMKARKEANTRENSSAEADSGETTQGRKDSIDCKDKTSSAYSTFSFSYNDHKMKEVSSSADADGAAVEQTCRGWYQDFLENTSSNIQNIEVKKKSSKKKKQKKMKSDHEDNDCDVELVMSNSKKGKTKKECKEKIPDDSVTVNSHASLESSELPSTCKIEEKKRSKKKKIKETVTVAPCEENKESKKKKIEENLTVAPCEENKESKKKKKIKETVPVAPCEENKESKKKKIEENVTVAPCEENKESKKKKKIKENVTVAPCEENKESKKKKIKENETVIVTASTCGSTSNIDNGNEGKNKQKKKKRKTCNKDEIVKNICALDETNINNNTTDAGSLEHTSEGSVIHNNETNVDTAHEQEKENTGCDGRKKKRKHCEKYSDEECCPVESKHDNNDDNDAINKKKKRRKDSHTSKPDNKETRDDNGRDNANSAAAKHKSNTSDAGNQNIGNITQSSEQPENKRNEKRRQKKKKKKVKDQCTKSKAFFPGSNIADIVGYGLISRNREKLKEKSGSSKPKRL